MATSRNPPQPISVQLEKARQLWLNEQYPKSVETFEAIVNEAPEHPQVLIDTARAQGQYFNHSRMQELCEQLLLLDPGNADYHLQVGMTYRMCLRPEKALKHFKVAVKTKSLFVIASLEIAIILERLGRLKEAQNWFTKVAKKDLLTPEFHVVHARILHRQGKKRNALNILKQVCDIPSTYISEETRSNASAFLARLYHQEKEPQKALNAALDSKKLQNIQAVELIKKLAPAGREVDQFLNLLTSQHFQNWKHYKTSSKLPLVCLMTSFPRSGTTLLETLIGEHSLITASDEMPVFTLKTMPALREATTEHDYQLSPDLLDKFDDEFIKDTGGSYCTSQLQALGMEEITPVLLDKNPSSTGLIPFYMRLFPNARILFPLRDPRDVIISCYLQHFPLNPFSAHFHSIESTAERYVTNMKHWLTIRPLLSSEQWLEIRYEDLVTSTEETMKQVISFLDLNWEDSCLKTGSSTTVHNAPTYADVQSKIHTDAQQRWRLYEAEFKPLRYLLEPIMSELGYEW